MRFQNIKVTDAGVELERIEKGNDGSVTKTEFSNPSKPLPPFTRAMQAFAGYSVDLIGAAAWHEEVKVSSIHLSEEPKSNRRGLIVTFTRRIERAKNRVVFVNTPLMHAPVDDQEGTNPGTFPVKVADMIHDLEDEATKYWNGEREQTEIFAAPVTAAAPGDELGARRGRKSRSAGTPNEVMNADKKIPPTDEALRQLLLTADRDVPVDAIAHWNSQERDEAQRWASAIIEAVLNRKSTKKLTEPACVEKSATLPLKAGAGDDDGWDEPNPLAKTKTATPPKAAGKDVHATTTGAAK